MNGIVAEGDETIEEFGESPTIDTVLVAAGQAVEHYEMACYGALAGWAMQLMKDAAALLNQTLQEERGKAADANCEKQSRPNSCYEGGSLARSG
jgi:ferritin-like metal-binding protein YciE